MNEYHRIYAEIDTDAILHNLRAIKSAMPKDCMLMPVIKADAYGHGAVKVASLIADEASYFAVATIEEAMELRNAGVKIPILILGTLSDRHFDEAVANDVTVNIYTDEMAKKLNDTARRLGIKARAHIAVDTGMGRIGISCDSEGIKLAQKLCSYSDIEVLGIFTHFATADMLDKTTANIQAERFEDFLSELRENGISIPIKHICNSAGICDMKSYSHSMVRPGIIIYGLMPSDEIANKLDLKPAMSLKSHVSYIKKVKKGEGISYGHTYIAPSDRIIATVPVGYADGYPRLLSNKGRVIIGGEFAPIVGRVCMDQFMVDITDIPNVRIDDIVTLIGKDNEREISADEIASHCETINYEIVCGISKRVPRVYK